jgi:hypothetical protein
MSLVRVWTNVGQKKPKDLLAKIFSSTEGPMYTVRYLVSMSEEDRTLYRYEDDEYEIDDDSVAEWLGIDDETDLGYVLVDEGTWIKEDLDSDYVPEEESTDDIDDEDEDDDFEISEEENEDYE